MCTAIAVFASQDVIDAYMRGEEIKPELPGMPKVFVEYQEKLRAKAAKISEDNANFASRKTNVIQNVDRGRIKELRDWAKKNLAQKSVYHDDFGKDILFTVTGIKEYLNQPHRYYFEKNQMIKDIQNILKNSDYKGITRYMGRTSHIFEIEIKGDKNWCIANERADGKVTFYSISDNDKVLRDVKK